MTRVCFFQCTQVLMGFCRMLDSGKLGERFVTGLIFFHVFPYTTLPAVAKGDNASISVLKVQGKCRFRDKQEGKSPFLRWCSPDSLTLGWLLTSSSTVTEEQKMKNFLFLWGKKKKSEIFLHGIF